MEKLFDETYEFSPIVCRNIWYGYLELYTDGEYGQQIILDENLTNTICAAVKRNLAEDLTPVPTMTNWFFYGSSVAPDAIGENIRPTIMIREQSGEFITNFNISDHDFAVNIDTILSFKALFEKRLASL